MAGLSCSDRCEGNETCNKFGPRPKSAKPRSECTLIGCLSLVHVKTDVFLAQMWKEGQHLFMTTFVAS